MGVKENIAAVSADVGGNAQAFFIEYFKQFPDDQNKFKDYKGVTPDNLRSVGKFASHTTKVVSRLLPMIQKAADGGSLASDAQEMKGMSQHSDISIQQFRNMFTALVPFLEGKLGKAACDSAGFKKAADQILAALQGVGF